MRIVLADDHPLIRSGIRATLVGQDSMQVVAESEDGDQALQDVLKHRPDLLMLDLSMPGLPARQLIAKARAALPDLKILVVTAYDDDRHVRSLADVPISGYLLKEEALENLLQAIRVIQQGAVWFSQSVVDKIRGFSRRASQTDALALNPRDLQILALLGRGLDNQVIAREVSLAEQTVRNYVSTLYQKIGVNTRAEAVVWARDHEI